MDASAAYLALEKNLFLISLDLGIIVLSARFFGGLFRRVGQPQVVGEILAGIILGPTILGRFFPGVVHSLLPQQVAFALSIMAQIGLVLLMLLIGLEFPFDRMNQALHWSLATAVAGIVVPFGVSFFAARSLFPVLGGIGGEMTFRLFFATAISITAIPIMGRILIETKLTRTRMGLVAISAAALDDVVGWLLLGVVVAITTKGSTSTGSVALALAAVLGLAAFFWGTGRFVLPNWKVKKNKRGGLHPAQLALVLGATFASASLTNALGVFSIFGGFLCGLSISFHHELRDAVKASLEDLVMVLLVPIFFVFSGLRTDLGSLGSEPRLWGALVFVVFISCATKFGATTLAARGTGLSWSESLGIGLLMNTRALMALVVINIGADLGVVTPPLFFILVTMALFTTVITTPILKRAYPTEKEAEWEHPTKEALATR